MSDYSRQEDFSTKSGQTISSAEVDSEFDALVVAVNSKVDESREGAASGIATLDAGALIVGGISGDPDLGGGQLPEASESLLGAVELATQTEVNTGTDALRVVTPDTLQGVFDQNGAVLTDLIGLSDPAGDRIFFWDLTDGNSKFLSIGDGIEISSTTLQLPASLAGDGITLTSGVLALDATAAGTGMTHSAGVLNVIGGNGITANANDVAITDVAATTTNPVDISSGAFDLDLTALTTIEGNALAAGDLILIDNGGVSNAIKVEEAGMRVQLAQTTQTLAASDMNSIMEFTGTATLTLPLNATTALPVGTPIILNVKHATQVLTVTAAASVTLVTTNHPAGGVAASDSVDAGGSAILYKTAADVWVMSGDISD